MAKHRQEKVGREILRELSTAIFEDVKDPRIAMITITNVTMSADLSVASVNYLCPKDMDRNEMQHALVCATPCLRSIIGDHLMLRRVPMLKFYYDDAYEKGAAMSDLLARLRAEGQMGSDDDR